MEVRGIDVVFFWVADLDRAVAWYTQTLGLQAGPRYGDWQEFRIPGETRFAVHGGADRTEAPSAVVAFLVSDLDRVIGELNDNGVAPIDEITDAGAARFVTYADPDGNQVQLLERPN